MNDIANNHKEFEFGRLLSGCRMCGGTSLYPFLDLGFHPPSDAMLSQSDLNKPQILFPLRVVQCTECGLTQLDYAANPKLLYGNNYLYESSVTETGKDHFFKMADSICKQFNLQNNSLIVDIGSNVGVLLEGFKRNNMRVLGIDPAPKISVIANQRGIETWNTFINESAAKEIVDQKGKASIVTGTNVFAHIDDKEGLLQALNILLEEDGVFIVEAPYLVDLIDNLEYDTIYLEHLEYISIKPLISFFHKYNMEVFRVEKHNIHGNSVRFFVSRKGKRKIEDSVEEFLNLEEEKKIYQRETLDKFAMNVKKHKEEIITLLNQLKKEGKKVIGISAPAKGNTLLNYCKIGPDTLHYITEKSKMKIGRYTPGMHIPIVEEEELYKQNADYGLILAWNFSEEIIKNNEGFKKTGGKFIIPIPYPRIV